MDPKPDQKLQQTRDFLDEQLRAKPLSVDLILAYAQCCRQMGDTRRADLSFKRALELQPDNAAALEALGRAAPPPTTSTGTGPTTGAGSTTGAGAAPAAAPATTPTFAGALDAQGEFSQDRVGPGPLRHDLRRSWSSYLTYLPLAVLVATAAYLIPGLLDLSPSTATTVHLAGLAALALLALWVLADHATAAYRIYTYRVDVISNPLLRTRRSLWLYEIDGDIYVSRNLLQALVGTATLSIEATTLPGRYPIVSGNPSPTRDLPGRLRLIGAGTHTELDQLQDDLNARVAHERRSMKQGFI